MGGLEKRMIRVQKETQWRQEMMKDEALVEQKEKEKGESALFRMEVKEREGRKESLSKLRHDVTKAINQDVRGVTELSPQDGEGRAENRYWYQSATREKKTEHVGRPILKNLGTEKGCGWTRDPGQSRSSGLWKGNLQRGSPGPIWGRGREV